MKRYGLMLLATATLLVPGAARAQTSASSTMTVTATVLKALTLTPSTATLAFGNLAQNSTKTVHATSGSAIKFTASGEPNTAVSVSFSTATLANGGASMTFTPEVTGYASDVQGSSTAITSGNSVTLDATTGSYYLWAGGAVTAGAAQATGAYSGTWTLTVAYTGI